MWTSIYEGGKWKLCTHCNIDKPEPDFCKVKVGPKTRKDGLSSWCKLCYSQHFKKPSIKERRKECQRNYLSHPRARALRRKSFRRYDHTERRKVLRRVYRNLPEVKMRMKISKDTYRSNPKNRNKERYKNLTFNAKRRGLLMEISFTQWIALTAKNLCHYCEAELGKSGHGLDRKNNNIGYVMSNVVPCCGECNSMKRCMPYSEFVLLSPALRRIKMGRKFRVAL